MQIEHGGVVCQASPTSQSSASLPPLGRPSWSSDAGVRWKHSQRHVDRSHDQVLQQQLHGLRSRYVTHTRLLLIIIITVSTRKHRQSYRHADPRRQQQHTAVAARVTSNRANVTVFVTV